MSLECSDVGVLRKESAGHGYELTAQAHVQLRLKKRGLSLGAIDVEAFRAASGPMGHFRLALTKRRGHY